MRAAVITISDGCYHQKREDSSGRALTEILSENQWIVAVTQVLPDELSQIQEQILSLTQDSQEIDLIVTTGGTGLGPRDVTPEAIQPLLEKDVVGLAELMRLRGLESTPFAALSRSVAGTRNQTLILSLPGSPKGATQSLKAVLEVLPHAVDLLKGQTAHGTS
ncbi:MogA/MoaB family molybdenum cofactor biosynthesis protein [Acidobacteria bacterium AH-259-D05]|nr:MogA/MoaB family molybdenum cofactor biosynthesis protein [Acidobacteria bacterium AH-259-D05]